MTEEVLFQQLVLMPESERGPFMDRYCPEPQLRARMEALLRADADFSIGTPPEQTSGMPDPELTGTLPVLQEIDFAGVLIAGRYKLLQQIGEGGMGTVWMAEQSTPVKRRVAVKLIRVERGQSKTILARFEAERQAIALMDHPHIAKLLDAGTTELGMPFFVMELVKGIPLNEYCDQHRLTVIDRLRLFIPICEAVQHAHQKGIIHRDLKPSNILVESHDGKAVPKVIDFGLAKATNGMQLSDKTLFTGFGSVLGTPLYMAPEQATFNAIDIDTRVDIYSLGIILYELLTGNTPITRETLKKIALEEMLRMIRELEAPTPSSRLSSADNSPTVAVNRQIELQKLGRMVKGELDWIVLKALAKDRERRYESATSFAHDIERYLQHEPITAGPPSKSYRLKKFIRRNRSSVFAGLAICLTLLIGMLGTVFGLMEAKRQASRAQQSATIASNAAKEERLAKNAESQQRILAQERLSEVQASRRELQQTLYESQLLTLNDRWNGKDISIARDLLQEMIPQGDAQNLIGMEWHYFNNLINGNQAKTIYPEVDGHPMYALPELYDEGRIMFFRQNMPNGYYFEGRSYETATGQPLLGFQPISGRYRTRQGLNFFAHLGNWRHENTLMLQQLDDAPQGKLPHGFDFSLPAGREPFAIYDVRTGFKKSELAQVSLDPALIRDGWFIDHGVNCEFQTYQPAHRFRSNYFFEKSLRATVISRKQQVKEESNGKWESRIFITHLESGKKIQLFEPVPNQLIGFEFDPKGELILTMHRQHNAPNKLIIWEIATGKQRWSIVKKFSKARFKYERVFVEMEAANKESALIQYDNKTGQQLEPINIQAIYGEPIEHPRWKVRINGNRVELLHPLTQQLWKKIHVDDEILTASFQDNGQRLVIVEMPNNGGVRTTIWHLLDDQVHERTRPYSKEDNQKLFNDLNKLDPRTSVWANRTTAVGMWQFQGGAARTANDNDPPGPGVYRLSNIKTNTTREIKLPKAILSRYATLSDFPIGPGNDLSNAAIHPGGRFVAIPCWLPDEAPNRIFAILDFSELTCRYIELSKNEVYEYKILNFHETKPILFYITSNQNRQLHAFDMLAHQQLWQQKLSNMFSFRQSPDGKCLAFSSNLSDETVLFDSDTGKLIQLLPAGPNLSGSINHDFMAWSADSSKLFWANKGHIYCWNHQGEVLHHRQDAFPGEWVVAGIDLSPKNDYIALKLKETNPEAHYLGLFKTDGLTSCTAEPYRLKTSFQCLFHPTERRLLVNRSTETRTQPNTLIIWDYPRGKPLVQIAIPTGTLQFSNDTNQLYVTGTDRTMVLDFSKFIATKEPPRPPINRKLLPVYSFGLNRQLTIFGPLNNVSVYRTNPTRASHFADIALAANGIEAVIAWKKVIQLDPHFASLHFEYGCSLLAIGQQLKAEQAFRRAIELDIDCYPAYLGLAYIKQEANQYDQAIDTLQHLLKVRPCSAKVLYELGKIYFKMNDLERARIHFKESLDTIQNQFSYPLDYDLPDNVSKDLFMVLAKLHDYQQLEIVAEKSVSLKKFFREGHIWKSIAYDLQGKETEASDYLSTHSGSILPFTTKSDALYARGGIYWQQLRMLDRAEADYREVLRLSPMNEMAHNDLGCVLRDQGKYDEALNHFDQATNLNKSLWFPYRNRAYIFKYQNKYDLAVKNFREAVKLRPNNSHDVTNLALCLQRLGQPEEGIKLLQSFVPLADTMDPKISATMWIYNSACLAALGGTRNVEPITPGVTRSQLRTQALSILEEQLQDYRQRFSANPELERAMISAETTHWLKDADLAGVRHPLALFQLPTDERQAWLNFWAKVGKFQQEFTK
ncbi:MAG: protein kinase [Zavarzinella sp.]